MTRTLVCLLALFGFADPALAQQPPEPPAPLTLQDAIAQAVSANRPLEAAELATTRAAEEAQALRTRRLPALDVKGLAGSLMAPFTLTFPAGSLGTFPATGPIPFADTEITSPARPVTAVLFTATQPLTQLRRIGLGMQVLDAERELAVLDARRQRIELVTNVKKVYYGLLQAQAARATVQEGLQLLTELQRVVAEYAAREAVLPADRMAVDARLAETELQRVTVDNTIASLSEQLNLLLGRDLATPFAVVRPQAAVPAIDLAAAQARAGDERTEVRQADLRAQQAALNVRVKREAFLPDVSLTAGYFGIYNVDIVPRHTAAAGVWFSWEPFDWGRRRLEKQAAQRQADAAAIARTETRERVRADVRARHRRLTEADAEARASEVNEQLAREKLRVARERLGQEAALVKDVLEAQVGVAQAAQRRQQAELARWTAAAELEQAIGEPAP